MNARTPTAISGLRIPSAAGIAATHEAALRSRADVIVATIAAVAVMFRVPFAAGLTIGDIVALALVPVWFTAVGRYRFGPALLILILLAIGSGAALSLLDGRRTVDSSLLFTGTGELLGIVVTVGALLWARSILGVGKVAVLAGIGIALRVPFIIDPSSSNVWKFFFEVPTTVLILALAAWTGKRWVELAALALLGAISLISDSRSLTAMMLMTVALVAWQARPMGRSRTGSTARTLLGIAALGSVVYMVVTALIFSGTLGQGALERSEAQIEASGSLLTGGRPELGASTALISAQPLGYGSGTLPTATDVLVAKSGMSELGYDPNNGYVERYLFGGGFEVHSVLGDLWIRYGLVGAAFGLALAALALLGSGSRIAARRASALVVLLSIRMLWELAFGPILTMLPLIIILIAIALPERSALAAVHPVHPAFPRPPMRPRP